MSNSQHSISALIAKAALMDLPQDSPRLDIELLLAHVLGQSRTYLYTWPEKHVTPLQYQQFHALLLRRSNGEPIAHLLGEKEFWSLILEVDASTLIPRPDTERLVELALDVCFAEAQVLDLGTGTGAIALALANELPELTVDAVDQHASAVALAQRNQQRLSLSNVHVFQSNWFSAIKRRYDIIVSNPPYIDQNDPHLKQGDVRFEPRSALVAEQQGLQDIAHICREAPRYLFDDGHLFIEHGWQQGEQVRLLFARSGFQEIVTHRDYGGHERVTCGCL